MKKIFAILFVAVLAFSTTLATDVSPENYGATFLNTSGAGQDDASFNDLSYDEAEGQYCIYVICPLELYPVNRQFIDLGYINPDGSRGLANEEMTWRVEGGNGWYFEANVSNDQFANESNQVYFVNPYWTYQMTGGAVESLGNNPGHVAQLQLSGKVGENGCENCETPHESNCTGGGEFTFYPNQVVATEIAIEGNYTWDLEVNVDYLTWVVPVMPDGSAYTAPQP